MNHKDSGKLVKKYLDTIGDHLQNGHAALLVGAGFSRNADKNSESVPPSPLWQDLATAFAQELSYSEDEINVLKWLDPLTLAERVEVLYGRPHLDDLLIDLIRDSDYSPSELHRDLLSLPWNDVFTTNYDTLLERTNNEITERRYHIVTTKEDLIGSASEPRIVKLHGSFPSIRPFIITAEDYRTYPQMFAPFVNTVQQSLLENTLCMIGFSGSDPNFQKWIGWIRDNLGRDNMSQIYLLQHEDISVAERMQLERQKIIPVNLALAFPKKSTFEVYLAAIKYLENRQKDEHFDSWNFDYPLIDSKGNLALFSEAYQYLKAIHGSYPGWVTIPRAKADYFRHTVIDYSRRILKEYCSHLDEKPVSDEELGFVYEYNWACERDMIPLLQGEVPCYLSILSRHNEEWSKYTAAIRLALMRYYRETGKWGEWREYCAEVEQHTGSLEPELFQRFQWEKCLFEMAQYHFQELNERLNDWDVRPEMHVWILRKAGLMAECGNLNGANDLLCQGISDIRRKLSQNRGVNIKLLSLESALMELKSYIAQAFQHYSHYDKGFAQPQNEDDPFKREDTSHQELHKKYRVAWEDQNSYFSSRLEARWKPFSNRADTPSFSFGELPHSFTIGSDLETITAFAFLRFREETGIPFLLYSVQYGVKAACGSAERIARFVPEWSALTLARTGSSKSLSSTFTRGVLCGWTRKEIDDLCLLYIEAVKNAERILQPDDWFFRKNFARNTVDVLLEMLSELCCKCSVDVLNQLVDLLELLYCSEKRSCFMQTRSLARRLAAAYPAEERKQLILRLLDFPVETKTHRDSVHYPDPIIYVPLSDSEDTPKSNVKADSVINALFTQARADDPYALSRLCYCLEHGLLDNEQRRLLSDLLWKDGEFCPPDGWLRVICLRLPVPDGIDVSAYLADLLTASIKGYMDEGERPKHDVNILNELNTVALNRMNAFTPEQISSVIHALSCRLKSLSKDYGIAISGIDKLSEDLFYSTLHSLWLITAVQNDWLPAECDKEHMRDILQTCQKTGWFHYGLQKYWGIFLDSEASGRENLTAYLCHSEKYRAEWGYRALAVAVRHMEYNLMTELDLRAGLDAVAQQIMWRAGCQLVFALQTLDVVVRYHPELISEEMLNQVMLGLDHLASETQIDIDCSIQDNAANGERRMNAAKLIHTFQRAGLAKEYAGVIDRWMGIISDTKEFSEIRNV